MSCCYFSTAEESFIKPGSGIHMNEERDGIYGVYLIKGTFDKRRRWSRMTAEALRVGVAERPSPEAQVQLEFQAVWSPAASALLLESREAGIGHSPTSPRPPLSKTKTPSQLLHIQGMRCIWNPFLFLLPFFSSSQWNDWNSNWKRFISVCFFLTWCHLFHIKSPCFIHRDQTCTSSSYAAQLLHFCPSKQTHQTSH